MQILMFKHPIHSQCQWFDQLIKLINPRYKLNYIQAENLKDKDMYVLLGFTWWHLPKMYK